jgi:nucleotide-binding universal stress UspA family protein
MFKKILVANDGSEGAAKAMSTAITLAKQSKCGLHMIAVEELPRFPASIEEVVEKQHTAKHQFTKVAQHARALAKANQVAVEVHLLAGHPVPTIVDFVGRERFDLLVVGHMGHSALYNKLIGSTTDRLVELAPCTVLVVK